MIMNNDLDLPEPQPHDAMRLNLSSTEETAEEKNEFLSSMGHELRNPLANILAQVETLVEGIYGPLENAQKTALAAIQGSARQVLQLIADVVDLGKIEADAAPLTPTACMVEETCARSVAMVADLAQSRSIQMTREVQPQDLRVQADARRLQQIITELLSAALLSTPTRGQVRLSIVEEGRGLHLQALCGASQAATGTVAARVEAAHHLRRIGKVKPIGMALLRQGVYLHGGSLTAYETAGQEVCLSIRLPLNGTPPAATTAAAESPVHEFPVTMETAPPVTSDQQPTILIADDQPSLLAVTRNYLESIGFQVITARDGSEAVQQACTMQPDLILMDVRMPVVDGLDAIRQIRASPDPKTRGIAIVSLSGHRGAADKEKCMTAGATAYLNKPFGVRELDSIIADYIRPPTT
jgi:CheY-like chemotaxis protein